jgi:hypothetical protein
MIEFVNYVYGKSRRFTANFLMDACSEARTAYFKGCYEQNGEYHEQDALEGKNLASTMQNCKKFVPNELWDEAIAWTKFKEAKQAYNSTKKPCSDSFHEMGICWSELGCSLPVMVWI